MSRRRRKNIGIIGLGIIGSRVREVLQGKGFHVFVWNRTPKPVPNFVGAPAELAEMCDFLQIFVSNDEALDYVVKQLSTALTARHIVIAHSTVSPHSMMAAAKVVEERGARFVEAPFTGSKEAAEKGELVYYMGGEAEAVKAARPLLEASSKKILEIGEVGQATAIKLATNMVTAATVQSAAEAMALIHSVGVPIEKFVSAMEGNASNSTTLAMKLPKMVGRKFDAHFSVKHMLKDMQIASRLGLAHHLELGVSAAARDRLSEQLQHGHGDEDYSAVVRKYFPDVPEPTDDQADLGLFASPEPTPASSPSASESEPAVTSGPTPAPVAAPVAIAPPAPNPVTRPAPEQPRPEEGFPQHLMPESFPVAAETPLGQANGGLATSEDDIDADFSSDLSEAEPARQRGFLSRLLRR
jgi:3-hydroxyisobutyrate dehydrogenase-like beta-hydroxyacid dehydrogenase